MRDRTEANTWKSLIAGLRFVFGRKVILATITLDLFAVSTWRRDSVDADLCRSDPARRPCRSRLDAGDAGNRRLCDGADGGAFAADETCRQKVALVRDRIWRCDDPVRVIENILVIARSAMSRRSVRQRERDHPRFDRATGHAG